MRGLRSTIVLLVILIGVGGYAYYISKKPAEDSSAKQEKVFASVQADKIEELRVKAASGDTTTLKKDNGGWQVVAPLAVHADESEVSGITNALTSMSVVRIVDENPTDLKEYGLAEPRIAVAFKASGDKDYRHLLVGEKSPTGADLFAKRNTDKRVFLIPAFQESSLNRSTFDLREKSLIKFDREKVDALDITTAGKSVQIAKQGGDWTLTRPVQVKADFGSVEGLVGRLQTVQMKSIAASDATAADLKKYGLDKPATTVNLNMGSARATLLIGGKADDATVYARDASKPMVMTVEGALADELKKGANEYRRKDVFEFRPYNANRLEIARNGQNIVFEKVKGKDDKSPDKWRRVSPNPGDLDKDKIEGLLSKLSNMRAASFVDSTAKTGVDSPAMTVSVKFDDGKKEERVRLGKVDNDAYAARQAEPGAAKIDTADFDAAVKAVDDISK